MYTSSDSNGGTDPATATVTLTGVNDPPVLNLDDDNNGGTEPNFAATFNTSVGVPISIVDTSLSIMDVDTGAMISSAVVTITNAQDGTDEILSALPNGAILAGDIVYDANNNVLTITRTTSLADYDAALTSVTYDNNAGTPTLAPPRMVDFIVNDGTDNSATVTSTVTLIEGPSVDLDLDDSTAAGVNFSVTFTEDISGPVIIADTDIEIISPFNLVCATVTLTNPQDGIAESLSVNVAGLPAGITVTGPTTGTTIKLTSTGASAADFETALLQITYDHTSNSPTTAPDRLVTVVLRDTIGIESDPAMATIAVVETNDPPVAADATSDAQANVGLSVSAANGLLQNLSSDLDAGDILNLLPANIATHVLTNGSLTIAADGSFTYTPDAGAAGVSDVFVYTTEDNRGGSDPGTLTFNVDTNLIWFVDNTNGSDGTLSNPFQTFGPLDDSGTNPDADNDTIFLYNDGGSHSLSDDFDLQNGQVVVGDGVPGAGSINNFLSFTTHPHSLALPNIGVPTGPAITTTSSDCFTLAMDNTIRGLDIGDTIAGSAIVDSGSPVGTATVSDVSITGNGGGITVANGGTLAMDFDEVSCTSSMSAGIFLQDVSGTFDVTTGDLNISNTNAVSIFNQTPTLTIDVTLGSVTSTSSSSGGISIQSFGGGPMSASLGGSFEVTGLTDIDNPSSDAIAITGFGATLSLDIDFATIDIDGGMSPGSSEGITISGLTGGTFDSTAIQVDGTDSDGILVTDSTGTFTFGDVDIAGTNTFGGLGGVNLANNPGSTFNFASLDITTPTNLGGLIATDAGTINITGTANTVNVTGRPALDITDTTLGNGSGGAMTFSSVSSTNSGFEGIDISNSQGSLTFTTVDIDGSTNAGINLTNNTTTAININGGTIDGTTGDGINSTNTSGLTVDGVTFGNTTTISGDGMEITNNDATARTVTLQNNLTVGGMPPITGRGIFINSSGTGTLTATVSTNDLRASDHAFETNDGGTAGSLVVSIDNNTWQTGMGIFASELIGSGLNSTIITSHNSNTITANGTGSGMLFDRITFDASGASLSGTQATATGTTQVGQGTGAGQRVQGDGVSFLNPTGDLAFTTLNIFNNAGTGLEVDTKGLSTTFNLATSAGDLPRKAVPLIMQEI